MAVSKRLRFEILRRDNFACRYCGATAPEVELRVDHVVPRALGGSDDPSNLVTACEPCNTGKTSMAPDSPIVDDVAADALRWAAAMAAATKIDRANRSSDAGFVADFAQMLVDVHFEDVALHELPELGNKEDFRRTVLQFRDCGLNMADLEYAARKAMGNKRLREEHIWRYFCGICWRTIDDRQSAARSLLNMEDASG